MTIAWALQSLGVHNVPGESAMKTIMRTLQSSCGIRTIQCEGAMGHTYFMNDL